MVKYIWGLIVAAVLGAAAVFWSKKKTSLGTTATKLAIENKEDWADKELAKAKAEAAADAQQSTNTIEGAVNDILKPDTKPGDDGLSDLF